METSCEPPGDDAADRQRHRRESRASKQTAEPRRETQTLHDNVNSLSGGTFTFSKHESGTGAVWSPLHLSSHF